MHPFPLSLHPGFSITHWQGFTEYCIEYWHLVHDGSGCILGQAVGQSWDADVLAGAVLMVWALVTHLCAG